MIFRSSWSAIPLGIVLGMVFAIRSAAAFQEPQIPPTGVTPPPRTGPAARTTENTPVKPSARTGGHGDFLAIGPPADPAAAARGQKSFVANCAFCHGSNAKGGNGGPSLVQSVLVLHDKGTGNEIGPVILHGRTAKGMPAFSFTDAQIKDVAAFLLSRSQGAANRMEYKLLNVVSGDAKAGESYFNAHCNSCHSGSGDLAHIATKYEPADLQGRFLYPKEPRRPEGTAPPPDSRAAKTATVTLPSGDSYTGKLTHRDDFSIALTEPAGEHRSWLLEEEKGIRVEVVDPLQAHVELLKQYSNADMHNILAYLETIK